MNPPGPANNVFIFFLLVKEASNSHMYVCDLAGERLQNLNPTFITFLNL